MPRVRRADAAGRRRRRPGVAVEAIRALGRLADRRRAPALLKIMQAPTSRSARCGSKRSPRSARSAATACSTAARLSGRSCPGDAGGGAALSARSRPGEVSSPCCRAWTRSALERARRAGVGARRLAAAGSRLPRLTAMLDDHDQRVIPAVLGALVKLRRARCGGRSLIERLAADDPVVRARRRRGLGELKPANGVAGADRGLPSRRARHDVCRARGGAGRARRLRRRGGDAGPDRGAGRQGLGGAACARPRCCRSSIRRPTPQRGSGRRRRRLPGASTRRRASSIRRCRPQVYIDTDRGTIQIELAVLDAPLTVENFVPLARDGLLRRTRHSTASCPTSSSRRAIRAATAKAARAITIRDELNERAVSARHGRHGARLGRHRRQSVLHHASRRSRISMRGTPSSGA